MSNLNKAVTKTLNLVFAEVNDEKEQFTKKRIEALKQSIGKIANIDINEFITNKNIRSFIDTSCENFLNLTESIKKFGILENIVAQLHINADETEYKLICIAGHRRILAAKKAGNITKIPTLIQSFEHEGDKVGVALAENLNREDLHCLDIADGYRELIIAKWNEADIASHFGKDIRTIKHYLKMSLWPKDIKELLRSNASIFSTRVILRNLAYKKFANHDELKSHILNMLKKPDIKKDKKPSNKKQLKQSLNQYLAKQKLLSDVIKEEITKAFIELKLI